MTTLGRARCTRWTQFFWVWHPGNTNSNLLAVPHQCTIDFHQVDALLHGLKRTGCSTDEVRGWSCFCGIHSMAESQALRNSSSGYAALTETTRTADSRRFLPSRPVLMAWAAPHRWPAIVVLLQALPTALIAENSQLRGVSSWFQETAPSAVLHTRPFSHAQPEGPWLSHRKRRPQPKINSGKTARPEKKGASWILDDSHWMRRSHEKSYSSTPGIVQKAAWTILGCWLPVQTLQPAYHAHWNYAANILKVQGYNSTPLWAFEHGPMWYRAPRWQHRNTRLVMAWFYIKSM